MRFNLRSVLSLLALSLLLSTPAYSDSISSPQGRVILSLLGAVQSSNHPDGGLHFDFNMLEQLPQQSFVTSTPYTETTHEYRGPSLSQVLKLAGIENRALTAAALNEYSVALSGKELDQAILAIRQDGQKMRIRNKGPIWLMFPLDKDQSLDRPSVHQQMIWQLRSISAN